MDNKSAMYQGLRFERHIGRVPRRLAVVGIALVSFTLLWWVVPANTLYWLLLSLIGLLAWMASYGWRQALAVVRDLLDRLEQTEKGV